VDAITREIVRLDREMWAERLHGPRGQERTVVHGHGFRLRELAAAATRVRGLEGRTGTTPPSTSRRTSSGASAPGGLSANEIVELRQRLMAMRIQAPGRSLAATPPSPTPTRRPARRGRPPIRPALRPPDPATAAAAPARRPPRQDHRVSRPSHRSQAPIKYREPLPAIQTVRTALEQLRIEHASSGRRVSVLSLARRPGIPNTTLRRTYPEICAEIAAATRTAATEPAADDSAYARHQRDNAALRRANRGTRRAPGDRHREHPAPQHRQPPAPARRSSHQRDAATSTTSSIPPRACGRTSRAKSLPTTLLKALRSLPTRPTPASGGSAAGHGCCSPSLTVPGFRYDQPSPYSANVITKGYGSSWIFEPYLTCANALRRVRHPAFSLVRPCWSARRRRD
jgi:hypothetical protein